MGLLSNLFTRKRHCPPDSGNTRYVKGDIFDPGAEVFATESKVGDPAYVTRVFPQWNFTPLEVYQPEMAFQYLAIPSDPPAGFPYGGLQPTGLIQDANYPDTQGDYYS